jgi:hypothetical protein
MEVEMTRKKTLLAATLAAGLAAAALGTPALAQGWGMMGGYGPGYSDRTDYGPGYGSGYGPGWMQRYGPGYRHPARYRGYGRGYGPGWMADYCFGRGGWR